jgi:PhnB protein
MKSMNVYLFFNGNCAEAMEFYKKCLGGELTLMKYSEGPMEKPEGADDKIMHAELRFDGIHMMAADIVDREELRFGENYHLSLNFETLEELQKSFDALGDNGKVTMPVQDTFWGASFGMLTDKFGINLMFNYDKPGNGNQ